MNQTFSSREDDDEVCQDKEVMRVPDNHLACDERSRDVEGLVANNVQSDLVFVFPHPVLFFFSEGG